MDENRLHTLRSNWIRRERDEPALEDLRRQAMADVRLAENTVGDDADVTELIDLIDNVAASDDVAVVRSLGELSVRLPLVRARLRQLSQQDDPAADLRNKVADQQKVVEHLRADHAEAVNQRSHAVATRRQSANLLAAAESGRHRLIDGTLSRQPAGNAEIELLRSEVVRRRAAESCADRVVDVLGELTTRATDRMRALETALASVTGG